MNKTLSKRCIFVICIALISLGCISAPVQAEQHPYVLVVNMSLYPESEGSANRICDALDQLQDEGNPVAYFMMHYSGVDAEFSGGREFSHIIFSGQGQPWDWYDWDELDAFAESVFETGLPVLGICGGHQFIAQYFGGTVDRIKRIDPDSEGYDGCLKETGYVPISNIHDCSIMDGIEDGTSFKENHFDEIKVMPGGFIQFASGELSQYQGIMHEYLPIYGVQFHPEGWDDEHLEGLRIILNFISMSR